MEQEHTKKSTLLSELSLQSSEVAHLKAKEMQLVKEVAQLREAKRKFEDDIVKIKNAHNIDIVQVNYLICRVLDRLINLTYLDERTTRST